MRQARLLQGVSKLGSMATPQDLLTLLASAGGPALHGATCACAAEDTIFVGTQQGQVATILLPPPGEHSVNTSLRAPDPQLLQVLQMHGASVTAIAVTGADPMASQHGCGAPSCVAVAARSGAVCVAVFSRDQGGAGAALRVICTMSDVKKSVTALVFVDCPLSADQRLQAVEHATAGGGGTCSRAGLLPHAGAADTQEASSVTTEAQARAPPNESGGRKLLLFACAHSDQVHRWRITLPESDVVCATHADATGGPCDRRVVATYCRALKGAGGSASPLQLCVASAGAVESSSPEAEAGVATGATSMLPSAGLPQVWVLAGCADRSMRGWAVTAAIAEAPSEELVERPSGGPDAQAAAAAVAAASDTLSECQSGVADASREAAEPPVVMDRRERDRRDEGLSQGGSTACSMAAGRASVPATMTAYAAPIAVLRQAEAPASSAGPSTGVAGAAQEATASAPSVLRMHETLGSGCEEAAGAPVGHVEGPGAGGTHALASPELDSLQLPAAAAAPVDSATAVPTSGSGDGKAGAASGCTHGSDIPKAAVRVAQGAAHTISRYAGVRASDTSRHRPRATALGTAALMSSYVDERLQTLNDAPGSHSTGLPGANCSSTRAAEVLDAASQHSMRGSSNDGGKAAGSARLAAISAAHRTALYLLLHDDVPAALDVVIAADALNADFVAMSAAAGPNVWRAVVGLHAARLEACGDIHLAAAYLCSARDFEGAVHAYQRSGLLLEAIAVAERHLPPAAALLRSLREQLAAQLLHSGGGAAATRWRGEVMAAAGGLGQALGVVLASGEGHQQLMHASGIAEAAGEADLAAELAARAALQAQAAAEQLAGVQQALAHNVGTAAVAAAVGTVGALLEAWLLAVLRSSSRGPVVTLEHAVRAAAVASQRHIELLGLAANSRAAVHAVEVGGDAAPSVQDVMALAIDLAKQVDGCAGGAAFMHAAHTNAHGFPCGLHVSPLLCASGDADAAAESVSLADMEPVFTAFAQAIGQSVRGCLRVSHHVVGAPLQPAVLGVLRETLRRLLRPLAITGAPQHGACQLAAVHRVAGMLVDGALARMSGAASAPDTHVMQADWRTWLSEQLRRLQGWRSSPPADSELNVEQAAGRVPWVAAIDEFVDTAAENGAETVESDHQPEEFEPEEAAEKVEGVWQKENVEGQPGFVEVRAGPPTVSVSAHALLELHSDLGGGSAAVACPDMDEGSSTNGLDGSVHAGHASAEPAVRSPSKTGKGRKRSGRRGGMHVAEGLSYDEVVSYQQVLQEFGPQDWARFRQEAMGGGAGEAVVLHGNGSEHDIIYGQELLETGEERGEKDVSGLAVGGSMPVVATADAVGHDGGGEDLVLSSWKHALSSHPVV